MSKSSSKSSGEPDPEEPAQQPDRRTIAPFVGALTIIVLVVIGIVVINGGDDPELTPEQQVRAAVVGQNAALQRVDYGGFREYTCRAAQGVEADVLAGQRESVEQRGERFVDSVDELHIDGDRATAKATYHFDKAPDDKSIEDVTLVREDGAWKVCEV